MQALTLLQKFFSVDMVIYAAIVLVAATALARRPMPLSPVAATLRRGEDPTEAIGQIREKNLALQREREWILEAGDFEEGYLDDAPICAKCGGTGYEGNGDRTVCIGFPIEAIKDRGQRETLIDDIR